MATGDCASARGGSPGRRSAIVAGGCRSLGSPRIRSPGAAPCVRDPTNARGAGLGAGQPFLASGGGVSFQAGGRVWGALVLSLGPATAFPRAQTANPETTNRHPTSRPSRATPPPKPPPTPYILGAWWLSGSEACVSPPEGIPESQLGSECVCVSVCGERGVDWGSGDIFVLVGNFQEPWLVVPSA